jgi:hypothetical protein
VIEIYFENVGEDNEFLGRILWSVKKKNHNLNEKHS